MAADEPGLLDEVGGPDRLGAEPQMRHRLRAGLLRVVDEVPLRMHSLLGAEDLDRVLVRPDGPIGAQAEEDRAGGVRRLDVERRVVVEARSRDVVGDADREAATRPLGLQLGEDARDHAGSELLRRQPVAAPDDPGHHLELAVGERIRHRRDRVEEERLPDRPRLLCPVEHGDAPHARRQRLDQSLCRKRTVEAELHDADALAAIGQARPPFPVRSLRPTPSRRRRGRPRDDPRSRPGCNGGRFVPRGPPSPPRRHRGRGHRTGSPSPAPGSRCPGSARFHG